MNILEMKTSIINEKKSYGKTEVKKNVIFHGRIWKDSVVHVILQVCFKGKWKFIRKRIWGKVEVTVG